jgi:hypothetical protein
LLRSCYWQKVPFSDIIYKRFFSQIESFIVLHIDDKYNNVILIINGIKIILMTIIVVLLIIWNVMLKNKVNQTTLNII